MLRRNISSVFVNSFLVNVPIPDLPFCHISGVFMGCDWGTLNSVYCRISLREKCPYSEFFWFVFSHIWTEYGPEKLRIRTLFTQCITDR